MLVGRRYQIINRYMGKGQQNITKHSRVAGKGEFLQYVWPAGDEMKPEDWLKYKEKTKSTLVNVEQIDRCLTTCFCSRFVRVDKESMRCILILNETWYHLSCFLKRWIRGGKSVIKWSLSTFMIRQILKYTQVRSRINNSVTHLMK